MLVTFFLFEGLFAFRLERSALGGSTLARAALRRFEASSGLFFLGNLGLVIEALRPGGLRLPWLARQRKLVAPWNARLRSLGYSRDFPEPVYCPPPNFYKRANA